MKKTRRSRPRKGAADDMLPEYRLNYSRAHPNRFVRQNKRGQVIVLLDPDVAQVFTTPESVNSALRALLAAIPQPKRRARTGK